MKHNLYMDRCLQLAELGRGKVAPNPMVGAVVVFDDMIIGEGFHQNFGGAHAEVNAINSVKDKSLLKSATIYVNLEPCSHYGKTPPCSDLIIQNEIPRVVIGCQDSYSEVSGKGIAKLRNANCEIVVGVLEKECRNLNKRFFTFHDKQRPYIILKWAQTQDRFMDKTRNEGDKGVNWITHQETKILVHQWRSEEQAIMVGTNTVINDNPELTVREVAGNSPIRIILDRQCKLDTSLKVFNDRAKTIVFNTEKSTIQNNVEYIKVAFESILLQSIMEELHRRDIQSVIVEGGKQLLESFIKDDFWDEARILIGDKKYTEGLKAPTILHSPIHEFTVGSDQVKLYQNISA